MRFDIMTLFPELVSSVLSESIIGRAQKSGAIEVHAHNIRDYSKDKHRRVDDTPYGGGKGMLMGPEPIYRCWESITSSLETKPRTVYLSPKGETLTQKKAYSYRDGGRLILLCGHYEGIDQRVIDEIVYRYKIRKEALFRGVADFVISSRGKIFSAKAIHGHVAKEYGECSVNTVMKYLEYLEGAYVISSVSQYSSRENRELKFYTKLYNADVALSALRRGEGAAELSCDIENTVYRELIFMGYSVVAYTCRSGEVDFLASRGNKKFFVQTAYSVADVNVRKRAFGAFREIDNLSQKILITCDNEDYSTSAVRHIAFKDFLLMTSLDAWECERYERYERHARPVASIREDPIASEVKRAPRKRPEPKPVETEAVDIKPAADIAQPKPKKKDISVYLL